MAGNPITVNTFAGDGARVTWNIEFSGGFIHRDHVIATEKTPQGVIKLRNIDWVSDAQIKIDPPVAAGSLLEVRRSTPRDRPLADFSDGAVLNEHSLDTNARQAVFIAAESIDLASGGLGELAVDLSHTLQVPPGEPVAVLPPAAARAGRAFVFDAAGRPAVATVEDGAMGSAALRADLSDVSGADLIGLNGRTVGDRLRDLPILPEDFGAVGDGIADDTIALHDALVSASASGMWIEIGGTYRITSPLTLSLDVVQWVGREGLIQCDFPDDSPHGVQINLGPGVQHRIIGTGLALDARHRCNRGWFFSQPIADYATGIDFAHLRASNVDMYSGPAVSAAGIVVQGGFGQVTLRKPEVREVRMRPGAGVATLRGVSGILVYNGWPNVDAYAVNIEIIEPLVDHVYSADPDYPYDMDGIGLFANPNQSVAGSSSSASVVRPKISRSWGRDVKTQIGYVVIDSPVSRRTEGPTDGIHNPAYDLQSGGGLIIGGDFLVATKCTPLGCVVSFQGAAEGGQASSKWMGGDVRVMPGIPLPFVARHQHIFPGGAEVSVFEGQRLFGPVERFVEISTTGPARDFVTVRSLSAQSLTHSLARVSAGVGAQPYRARLTVESCVSMGADVPLCTANVPGSGAFARVYAQNNVGFMEHGPSLTVNDTDLGTGSFTGRRWPEPVPGDAFAITGSERDYATVLAAGQTWSLPNHGSAGCYLAWIVMGFDVQSFAHLSVSQTALVTLHSGTSATVGSGGDPGSGYLRVWLEDSTLRIHNGTAASRPVMVKLFG